MKKVTPINQKFTRRDILRLAGVGGSAALLAACAPPSPAAPAAPVATAAAAPAESTVAPAAEAEATAVIRQIGDNDADAVTFWTPGGSAVYCTNFQTISEQFTKLNPGITIGTAQCGAGSQNFLEIFLARVAAGNPPDVSVIWDSPVSLAVRGALEPLDELMAGSQYSQIANWPAGLLSSCQYNGATYGLPVAAGTYAMYYNAGLFEKKGIPSKREDFPKTLADLRKLSKEFTVWNGDTLESVGYLPTQPDMVELNVFSALNGSQFYDGALNKFTIDSEQNIELMQFMLDWFVEEYKGDLAVVTAAGNWGFYPDENLRPPLFQAGKVAMKSDGFWVSGDMYGVDIGPEGQNWNVAQYPVGPSGTGTKSGYWPNWMVIPKGAKRRDDGFKYIDYMSGKGVEQWFKAVPDLPTNKNVSPDLMPDKVTEMRDETFAKDMMSFFRGQLDVATAMWNSPVQNFANDQITRMKEQVFTRTASPKDALTEAQTACQAELDKVLKGA